LPDLLYIDSSTLLTVALRQEGHEDVRAVLRTAQSQGAIPASSRLLWLEARRVAIREAQVGNDVGAFINAALQTVTRLPVTEEVWDRAARIEQHLSTLDALHLATCESVSATLLVARLDGGLRAVAAARGIPLAGQPRAL